MLIDEHCGFRVVLFWTELKRMPASSYVAERFRVVLFWTELKQEGC